MIGFKEFICIVNVHTRETGDTVFQSLVLIGFVKRMSGELQELFCYSNFKVKSSAYRNDCSKA